MQNEILMRNSRIIIPIKLRRKTMEQLHYGHTGITGCLNRAREIVYWPNMTSEIKVFVNVEFGCNDQKEQK